MDQSTPSRPQRGRLHLKDLEYILLGLNIVMSIQALQKEVSNLGLGPTKVPNGPKKVPILLPSPKFLILPSDDAEKGRHIAVSHCCVLFGHTQCIMCMSLILSSPIIFTER